MCIRDRFGTAIGASVNAIAIVSDVAIIFFSFIIHYLSFFHLFGFRYREPISDTNGTAKIIPMVPDIPLNSSIPIEYIFIIWLYGYEYA